MVSLKQQKQVCWKVFSVVLCFTFTGSMKHLAARTLFSFRKYASRSSKPAGTLFH